jgi:hypothetical protein
MSITFREFVEILEGKKKKKLEQPNPEPPNAVRGTYQEHPDGYKTYTLKPAKPFKKPLSKNEISKKLEKQGGIGGGAVRRALKKREEQQEGFSIKKSQQELEKKRKEAEQRKKKEAEQRREQLRQERVYGSGIRGRSGGKGGWFKDGKFTPDADT